jgi:CDP-paratose 2-epimerase
MRTPRGLDRAQRRPILITGGSGFIGCNIADALATGGHQILLLDNFVRWGAKEHARWLKQRHGERIKIEVADIRDAARVADATEKASAVLHLAAQVAVTASLDAPRADFEINAGGTLNVLEAVRVRNPQVPVLFASTNKVYGRLLADDAVRQCGERYVPAERALSAGVSEAAALDFHSPYGCSKGAADQYVRDYARVFGLRAAVLRMSCIYGPRQFGTEDQGWIAHFMLQAIQGKPIVIYGDGLQVRDALHVSDAVAAWIGALERIDRISGRVLNLGGGPENSVSLLELLDLIGELRGSTPVARFAPRRPGDQPWYVSNIAAICETLGWQPRTNLRAGLLSLHEWLAGRFGSTAARIEREKVQA